MATVGYSGTPLPKKLGIKEGSQVALVAAPDGFEGELEPLPFGARIERRDRKLGGPFDVVVFFPRGRAELERRFEEIGAALEPAGGLWIAWPKKSSRVATDLTEDVLREVVLPTGWVDNKVCAISDVHSGLRFVRRKENRPGKG